MPSGSDPKPYKVKPDEIDGAEVIDRVSGQVVGYLRRWAPGWSAYLTCQPGWELPAGWHTVEDRIAEALGWLRRPILHTKLRKDAAELVWAMHTRGGLDS